MSVQAPLPAQGCVAGCPCNSSREKAPSTTRGCLQPPGPLPGQGLMDSRAALWGAGDPSWKGEHKGRWPESPAGMGGHVSHGSGASTNLLLLCPQSSSRAASWPLPASSPSGTLAPTPCILPQESPWGGWRCQGPGIEMPLPLGAQHSTVRRVLLPSLGPSLSAG